MAFSIGKGIGAGDMVFHLSRKAAGMTLRELGNVAAGLDYAAVSVAIRRVEQRLRENTALQKAVPCIAKMLNV